MEALLAHSQWLLLLGSSWQAQILPLQGTAKQLDAREIYVMRGMRLSTTCLNCPSHIQNLILYFPSSAHKLQGNRCTFCEGRNGLCYQRRQPFMWLVEPVYRQAPLFSTFLCVKVHVEAYFLCVQAALANLKRQAH